MKFIVKSITKNSGRLGQLCVKESSEMQTPMLMQTTKGGSIPFLCGEAFDKVIKEQPQLLQLTLSTMDQMAESVAMWKRSLSEYVGLPGHNTLLLLRDPCETTPGGGNDQGVIPIFTRRGKESLTTEKYMKMVASFAPDVYQGLCDADTNLDSSKKRVQKAVNRTESFMDQCYEQHQKLPELANSTLLAPIVGGYNTFARSQSIQHARKQPANSYGGYVFEGFHTNGLGASEIQCADLLGVVQHCLEQLEDDKPRLMPGAFTPLVTLELIRLGVDIFDTSYAYCAAANYKALTFGFNVDDEAKHSAFLDLTDECHREDFTPLVSGCSCLACQDHTRAYIHHLYRTKELLAGILLMIHNLHHYSLFFEQIRASMCSDKLPQLIEYVRTQNTSSPVDYCIRPALKMKSQSAVGDGFGAAAV